MADSDLISKYFAEYARKGFRKIFALQKNIAATKIYAKKAFRSDGSPRSRSGRLMQALESPSLYLDSGAASLDAIAKYPKYIRFLDMKRLGNYKIYNRPIWGILYRETIQDIRYEFLSWCQRNCVDSIREGYQQS